MWGEAVGAEGMSLRGGDNDFLGFFPFPMLPPPLFFLIIPGHPPQPSKAGLPTTSVGSSPNWYYGRVLLCFPSVASWDRTLDIFLFPFGVMSETIDTWPS